MLDSRMTRHVGAIEESYGAGWRLKSTSNGGLYVINDAAGAPTFSLFTGGLSKHFTDLSGSSRTLATDERGRVTSQVAVCLSDTTDMGSMVARNIEVLATEANNRPTLVAGHSAGGAVSRAVSGTRPDLVDVVMDFASVGNSRHLDVAFWNFASKCIVALGEGDTLAERVRSGVAHTLSVSPEAGDEWLRKVFGAPLTKLNGVVRGAELMMSGFNGPNAYKDVIRAIQRFSRSQGPDEIGIKAMAWFCSTLRVTDEMQVLGELRKTGKGPISIPVHALRDWVCTDAMYRDAMRMMRSPAGLQVPGLSHEFELDNPLIAPFVRTVRDSLQELRNGAPAELLVARLETTKHSDSRTVMVSTPTVTAEPVGLEQRFGLLPGA